MIESNTDKEQRASIPYYFQGSILMGDKITEISSIFPDIDSSNMQEFLYNQILRSIERLNSTRILITQSKEFESLQAELLNLAIKRELLKKYTQVSLQRGVLISKEEDCIILLNINPNNPFIISQFEISANKGDIRIEESLIDLAILRKQPPKVNLHTVDKMSVLNELKRQPVLNHILEGMSKKTKGGRTLYRVITGLISFIFVSIGEVLNDLLYREIVDY